MTKRTQSGICHICGSNGPLSFEHVPPRSAFNDKPVVWHIGREGVDGMTPSRGEIKRRGVGAYTLCPTCNSQTGSWYGSAYAKWAYQGMDLIEYAEGVTNLYPTFRIFPLRVIKQVFVMFFSVNRSPNFADSHQDLVRFVLSKHDKDAHPLLRVLAYLNASLMMRQSATLGAIDFARGGTTHQYGEHVFPPFGYILAVDGESPDARLADISFFSGYSYGQQADVTFRLPVFHPCRWVPGDFRSPEEVGADIEKNRVRL